MEPTPTPPPDRSIGDRIPADQATMLGRLGDLARWAVSCLGSFPPRPFERTHLVVFAHDRTQRDDADSAVVELATRAGVVRHEIVCAAGPAAAVATGTQTADHCVDAGADLLIVGTGGDRAETAARVVVAAVTGAEPTEIVAAIPGYDAAWARTVTEVRDLLFNLHTVTDPVGLLTGCGDAAMAAVAGFLAHAAIRRTPVLLDGFVETAAAVVADGMTPGGRAWWKLADRRPDPGHDRAITALAMQPVLDLGIRRGGGLAGLLAFDVLQAASVLSAPRRSGDEFC